VDSTTKAKVKPKHPEPGERVKLKVVVKAANGVTVTGQVRVKVNGKSKIVTLANGEATVRLGRFSAGTYKVKVTYLGSTSVERSKDTVRFTVEK
jgi:hypothetical protein